MTKIPIPLALTWSVTTGALILFSQSGAGYSDEGVHLLASQLILRGQMPYLDFFHQHPPLYLFLNAAWMAIFGDTWRSAHLFSALMTSGAVIITGKFVYDRLIQPSWRLPAAMIASLLAAFHLMLFQFGIIGQPYALCLLLMMIALYFVTRSDRRIARVAFVAGLCAGAAAASWMLSLPLFIILFVWIVKRAPSRDRPKIAGFFLVGSAIPFLPLIWLALQSPRQVIFDVVEFHLFHRRLGSWTEQNVARWDADVLTRWLRSTQTLLMLIPATLGFFIVRKKMESTQQRDFSLCVWMIPALASLSAFAHPTFPQYFILLIPPLAILASIGLAASVWIIRPFISPLWATIILAIIFAYPTEKLLLRETTSNTSQWLITEQIAKQVSEKSKPGDKIYAGEPVYFASRRRAPTGMENSYAAKLDLPYAFCRSIHIVKRHEISRQLHAGEFHLVVVWAEDRRIDMDQLRRNYDQQSRFGNYYVFSRSRFTK